MRDDVGVVIPAYNEAGRLPNVLEPVLASSVVRSIVVVDDGSTDSTYAVATHYAGTGLVRVVRLPYNCGKATAVWNGIRHIDTSIVVLLDADLLGLSPKHVEMLAHPIAIGEADMTIGVFRKGRWTTDWSHRIAPEISGQRGLLTQRLLELPSPDGLGYGLEAFLNRWARRTGWRVQHVVLHGVSHVTKE
ncbi:MAG TPA: glycosyltransferase family 2 protein, partial [Armatimonadetes bacterium]|nr:glycosyltransferase family 2 protein [Armatimonadota bacterium]